MKRFFSKSKREKGFTLVEMVVVIVILGILGGFGTVGYSGYVKSANDVTVLARLTEISKAAQVANSIKLDEVACIKVNEEGGAEIFKKVGNDAVTLFPTSDYADCIQLIENVSVVGPYGFVLGGNISDVMLKSKTYTQGAFWTGEAGWQSIREYDMMDRSIIKTDGVVTNPYLVNVFAKSSFSSKGTTRQLTQAVDGLAYTMGSMTGSPVNSLASDTAIKTYMTNTLGLTQSQINSLTTQQKTAAVIMYTAEKTKGLSVDAILEKEASGTSLASVNANTIGDFAAQYATILGYAYNNQDVRMNQYNACGNVTGESKYNLYEYLTSGDQIGGSNMTYGVFREIAQSDGYKEYKQTEQAREDIEGFLAAMNLIASNTDNVNVLDATSYKYFQTAMTPFVDSAIDY